MKWEDSVKDSENILGSQHVPSSLDIITLIKKVNPTRLTLSETDRARGYRLKHRLQSLLLEHYGDSFHLVPHPASPNIILIKHRLLPSIDACHAELAALSDEAVEMAETAAPARSAKEEPKRAREKGGGETKAPFTPKETLKKAQSLLDEYDYAAAEKVLAGLQVDDNADLPLLERAAGILLYEIGAFQSCIDMLLGHPRQILKKRQVMELLAVAYHRNGALPEARAILQELHPAGLGHEALFAYAEIAFKDGNLSTALELVKIAAGKEGLLPGLESLRKEIEAAVSAQAEPVVQKAWNAFRSAAPEEARRLAQEALHLYPGCPEARAVITAIEALDAEAQLAELWARLESEPRGERRMHLLATLLERDKKKTEAIKTLIAEEKSLQRRMRFDEQLAALGTLVHEERWGECFEVVISLMRQPEFDARADEVLSLSPFFHALHKNKRLLSAPERTAKEVWVRFVEARVALATGNDEGCFETLEELKTWFRSCPEFKEEYLLLLQRRQEKARREIAALLEKGEAVGLRADEVRTIYACIRRKMQVLSTEERHALARTMEERLALFGAEEDSDRPLEEYREALQIGNSEKASYLRQEITNIPAREALEAEFAELFHIAWEPLTLEVSADLPIDLTTPPPLPLSFAGHNWILAVDGPDTFIMINPSAGAACRMTSPIFAKAELTDYTMAGSFIFREKTGDKEYGDRVWRAELSVADGAAFSAAFDMREWFEVEGGFSIVNAALCSERNTDYYALIEHDEGRHPPKVQRKRLAPRSTVETLQLGNRGKPVMRRWRSCPDQFIVGGKGEMRHVNRNLSLKASLSTTPNIYRIDSANGYVYSVENEIVVTQRDQKLSLVRDFPHACCLGLFEPERVYGMSFKTNIALIMLGSGKQAFYDMNTNRFSQKVRLGRVIPATHEGKWYCFDYSRTEGKVWLRDITTDIHAMLEWREFFFPRQKARKSGKSLVWFHKRNNFVYRPEEW